jgi:hypothetical protein
MVEQKDSSIELLIELHDVIKQHPYRLSGELKYWSDYRTLLYKFSDVSYWEIKKVYNDKYTNWGGMWHDFNWAIGSRSIIHIERCIGSIHKFIDTGEFDGYYTYYAGCNIDKGVNRLRKYVLDKKENKFFPIYTEEEFDIIINRINSDLQNPKYDWFKKYNLTSLEYYTKLKERMEVSV